MSRQDTKLIQNQHSLMNSESGALLVMVSILLIVLIGLIALILDLSVFSISKSQGRDTIRVAALAALEEYYHHDTLLPEERLNQALSRAEEVLGQNITIGKTTQSNVEINTANSPSQLSLVPGRYYYDLAQDGSNPCTGGRTVPCFVPVTSTEEATAFQINGNFGGGIQTRFAHAAFGTSKIDATISATSTLVPRYGCFLVDISNSMVRETHPRWIESPPGSGNGIDEKIYEYSYYLSEFEPPSAYESFNPGASRDHNCSWDRLNGDNSSCADSTSSVHSGSNRDPLDIVIPTEHFKDDYEVVEVFSDLDWNPLIHDGRHPNPANLPEFSAPGGSYLVDTFRRGNYNDDPLRPNSYIGPEPLTTVFKGLEKAIEDFKKRAVSGDKACIIFFDQDLTWPRIFTLTDDWDYLLSHLDLSGNYDPFSATPNSLTKALKHGLFPSIRSFSAAKRAIHEAERQFSVAHASSEIPHSDFIVMIGDGIANCTTCPGQSEGDRDGDGDFEECEYFEMVGCQERAATDAPDLSFTETCHLPNPEYQWTDNCTFWDTNGDGHVSLDEIDIIDQIYQSTFECGLSGCSDSKGHYQVAMGEINRHASSNLWNSKVQLHTMLVGQTVGPHTKDVWSADDGRCMSELEKRLDPHGELHAVNDNWWGACDSPYDPLGFIRKSPFCEFREPNLDWWKATRNTGGIWAPLRPAHDPRYPIGSSCGGECQYPNDLERSVRYGDPECRTRTEQIEDYMREFLRSNPYTIVDEDD